MTVIVRRYKMWVFNVDGFFSVVQSDRDPELVMVRARFREDLERVAKKLGAEKIHDTPKNDYPFRVYVKKTAWADYLLTSAQEIDYTNFKNRALKGASRDRSDRYHAVWADMAFGSMDMGQFRKG